MRLFYLIICLILLICIKYSVKLYNNLITNTKESFYLTNMYTPTYFERNPLICYVSKSEYYLDSNFFSEYLINKFPLKITSDPKMKYKSDLCILPEVIIYDSRDKNNNFKYDFMSTLKDISFSYIQLFNTSRKILKFDEVDNSFKVGIKSGGYTEELWKKIGLLYNIEKKKWLNNLIFYDDEIKLKNDLKSRKIDCIAIICSHPSKYIFEMSYDFKIRLVPLEIDSYLLNILSYYLKGLKETIINVKNYRYPELKTKINSHGYNLSLFVNKSLPEEVVKEITEVIFKPKNIIRSVAVSGSEYIPFHKGTEKWLIEKGYISLEYPSKEHPSCSLLAGKSTCSGISREMAIREYNSIFWKDTNFPDQSMVSSLKNIKSKLDSEDSNSKDFKLLKKSESCLENQRIRYKNECLSLGYTWDAPCLDNSDCPFYKSNMNYSNNFGGCKHDGFCELPIGLERKGYTQYKGKPVCHNCSSNNPFCCKEDELYASPDFAFKNDINQRKKNIKELTERNIKV